MLLQNASSITNLYIARSIAVYQCKWFRLSKLLSPHLAALSCLVMEMLGCFVPLPSPGRADPCSARCSCPAVQPSGRYEDRLAVRGICFQHSTPRPGSTKRVFPDLDTEPALRRSNKLDAVEEADPLSPKRIRHASHEQCLGEGGREADQCKVPDKSSNSAARHDKCSVLDQHLTPLLKCSDDDEVSHGSCLSCIKNLLCNVRTRISELRWSSKKRRSGKRKGADFTGWEALPLDLCAKVVLRLPLREFFLSRTVSRSCKKLAGSDTVLQLRGKAGEGLFTAINFFIKDGAWQCTGRDLHLNTWRRLPTFSCLPKPDASLFKEYLVCGDGALMCVNVSKVADREELIVFNLLTAETRRLPPLNYPRNPVVLHLVFDSATNSYKVVAAGSSSSSGEENLSRRVEVFSSVTSRWEVAPDIPGPEFALNEHQAGVYVDGILYFVAFLEVDGKKGVLGFDVEKGDWANSCAVPYSSCSNTLQLVKNDEKAYLFSEQEQGGIVEHCIDELDTVMCELKSCVKVKKSGGRGLLVYPEVICVPYGEGKLCIFNTLKRDGLVYDVENGMQSLELEPPPESQRGENFFSLNPVSFALQPNFTCKP